MSEQMQHNGNKPHNSTYCREWVSKSMNYKFNMSLAPTDGPTENNSVNSLDMRSLNISSASHSNKVPEHTGEKLPKFISQRHPSREITKLPKQKEKQSATM